MHDRPFGPMDSVLNPGFRDSSAFIRVESKLFAIPLLSANDQKLVAPV
jgi:hypothetical protein